MPHRAAIVTALLLQRPLCMECLCDKAGMKPVRVKATLAAISRALRVRHHDKARCRACGEYTATVSIDAVE